MWYTLAGPKLELFFVSQYSCKCHVPQFIKFKAKPISVNGVKKTSKIHNKASDIMFKIESLSRHDEQCIVLLLSET